MTPEEKKLLEDVSTKLDLFLGLYYSENFTSKMSLKRSFEVTNANQATTIKVIDNKIGFFGKVPAAQQTAVTTPSGGGSSSSDAIDQTARTAIGQIKTALQNLGLTL